MNRYVAACAAVLFLLFATVWSLDRHHQNVAHQAEIAAKVKEGEERARKEEAAKHEKLASDLQADNAKKAADLGRLAGERDALLRKLAPKPPQPPHDPPGTPGGSVVPDPDPRDAVIEKDAEVIEAQDALIVGLREENGELRQATEQLRLALDACDKRAQLQEVATEQWKKAVKESEWRGFGKGSVAGAGTALLLKALLRF